MSLPAGVIDELELRWFRNVGTKLALRAA